MPIYVFKCSKCGHEFEEILGIDKMNAVLKCKLCKEDSNRKIPAPFGISSTIDPKRDTVYSSKEIDHVVGKASEEKWTGYNEKWKKRYEDRQAKRWGDKKPEVISLPKDPDGKYTPIAHLGSKKEVGIRKDFSVALKEHRKERESKGLGQFEGSGAISVDK